MVLWLIEWDMLSWLVELPFPMVSCPMCDSFDMAVWPMLSWDMVLWDVVSCDMVDVLWAKAGTANAAATRAAAAKVVIRIDIDDSFKRC